MIVCNHCANYHFSKYKVTVSQCSLCYLRYHNYVHTQKEEIAVVHHILWCGECREICFGGCVISAFVEPNNHKHLKEITWFIAHTVKTFLGGLWISCSFLSDIYMHVGM